MMRQFFKMAFSLAIIFSFVGYSSAASKCLFCSGIQCATRLIDTCNSANAFCIKSVTLTGGVEVFTKGCRDTCTNQLTTFGPTSVTDFCCTTDLCNGSPSLLRESKLKVVFVGALTLFAAFKIRFQ